MTSIIILIFAGLIDGIVEGYEFDGRRYFERKFKADPYGFWGSKSWNRKYTRPNVWNKYMGVFDFYHLADDLRKLGYLTGGILIASKYVFWKALLIAWVVSAVAKKAGMYFIRKK